VLRLAKGLATTAIASPVCILCSTRLGKWRRRYLESGFSGLLDEATAGHFAQLGDAHRGARADATLESTPEDARHWSTRSWPSELASAATRFSALQAFSLAPHRSETFRVYPASAVIDKVRDIVGLYLLLRERALVLLVDDKSQIKP